MFQNRRPPGRHNAADLPIVGFMLLFAIAIAGCEQTSDPDTVEQPSAAAVTDDQSEGIALEPATIREFKTLAQFESAREFVDTEHGRIAVVENGSGPVAVFLHGFPLNGFHWRHQLTELAHLRRCIAIDLMGLGYTEAHPDQSLNISAQAEMVLSTLDALGVEAFDLVGNDTGGAVAQLIAVRAPERIRSLVLTNADIHDNFPPKALRAVHNAATAGTLDELFLSYLADPKLAQEGLGAMVYENPSNLTAELLDAYLEPITSNAMRRGQMNRYITSLDNAETVAIKTDLESFAAPTLVLWAMSDPFFGVEWAHWLRDTIPGVRQVVEITDAKLFFAEERGAEVTNHIRHHWLTTSIPGDARP